MPSQLSPRLEARGELADLVRSEDRVLMPMLLEHSQTARALWDLSQDQRAREVLTLLLTDPWGSAAGDFAPDELRSEGHFRRRVYELIGEMIMPGRPEEPRVRIELRDAFVLTNQLEQLRLRLGEIPDIARARLRMNNQVRFVPQRPDNYLLTDFAIEVNEPFAAAVRAVAVACGFQLREDPLLIRREGVRDALLRLVEGHRRDGQPNPDFALCFQLQDRETIHLLEVSREAAELEDGSIDGVGFAARSVVPHAHSLKIYLAHPNDLLTAFRVNRDHPLFNDLRNGNCEFLLPDDGGEAFRRAFPDLPRG
jgi:hypothetical protein